MEENLIAFLLADVPLKALVGTKINWLQRPQASALPAITLQRISDLPTNDGCGADALTETRVQIDCWGLTFTSVLAVSRAVEAALSGQSFTHGTTEFVSVFIDASSDTAEPGTTQGSIIHRVRTDYQFWHREEN